MINVQIVYPLPENPTIIDCQVTVGSTVGQAIVQSTILSKCQLSLEQLNVGIYGKLVTLTHLVSDGDRIEIYRPLLNDPKEIRRQRAKLKRK
ncbi:RnfH family protein [Orbus mooreae]|uniref:RnfH family protein n=1 Tax=Orbus mooreae TaxID=3074107 RepID=UPI00370DA0B4